MRRAPPTEAGCRVRRHRLPRVRRATRAAHGRGRDRAACSNGCSRHDVQLSCAGRTDTGVHAWTQVVSCAVDASADPAVLQRAVNGHLAPEVVVRSAELVDAEFDARRSAQWRQYRYTIVNRDAARSVPRPVRVVGPGSARPRADAAGVGSVPRRARLLELLPQAARRAPPPCAVCSRRNGATRATACSSTRSGRPSFCWQMVRSIVGTLADVGIGKIRPGRHPRDPAGSRSQRRRSAGAAERVVPLGCRATSWVP